MRRLLSLLCVVALTVSSLAAEEKQELTVFAAASLTDAFKAIGKRFEEQHPNVTVSFSFGASNRLRLQIEQGAAADVFASANMAEMETAIKSKLVKEDASKIFARNRLVLIVPKSNPARIEKLADLAKPGIKVVVAHENVPVGKYALEMFDKASHQQAFGEGFKDKVLANVVSKEENVKSVVAKVRLSSADAGIAYVSDITEAAAKELTAIEIPDEINLIATYPIAPIGSSKHAELAAKFVDYVLSDKGQQALTQQGFLSASVKK